MSSIRLEPDGDIGARLMQCPLCGQDSSVALLGVSMNGNRWVITHEAAERVFGKDSVSKGVAFIDAETATKLGLRE